MGWPLGGKPKLCDRRWGGPKTKDIKTTSRIKIGNDTDVDVNFEPLDISHAEDAVNNLRNFDVESFMLSNEEVPEDMRYNDIDDNDMNLFNDIAAALGGL